jgi:hypothetical protein
LGGPGSTSEGNNEEKKISDLPGNLIQNFPTLVAVGGVGQLDEIWKPHFKPLRQEPKLKRINLPPFIDGFIFPLILRI